MSAVVIVMPAGGSPLTDELAATLRHELGLQDIPTQPSRGAFPEDRLGQVHLLLDPQGWVREQRSLPAAPALRRTIVLCEELPAEADEAMVALLDGAGAVFVADPRHAVLLRRLIDVRPRVLRPGYSELLDRFDADADRPVDVAVIGADAGSPLAESAGLRDRRCVIVQPGEVRLDLLSRSQVAINVHPADGSQLEWRQVLDAIHCGAVVVTEHSDGIAPLTAGEHLLVGARASLPFLADALLRDPERLQRMRLAAYERLLTWIPYALPVSVLRAAIVELVGEPVAATDAVTASSAG